MTKDLIFADRYHQIAQSSTYRPAPVKS